MRWNLDIEGLKDFENKIDSSKGKIDELGDKAKGKSREMSDAFRDAASNIKNGFNEIGAVGIGLGIGFTALATKAAFSASRVDELTLALHAIGKANNIATEETDKAVTALRKNNIAYADSLQITSRFIQNELKLTDAIKLSNVAKDLAVVAGLGSSEATNILTEAISSQSTMALRQFGIVKGLDQIYDDYARSISGGSSATVVNTKKTAQNVEKLSDLQGKLGIANMRIGEFTDKTKASTRATAQMGIDKLNRQIASLTGNTTAYSSASSGLSENLTEQQKKQAFLNAVLEAGVKVTGTYDAAMMSSGKQFRSFTTRILPDFIVSMGRAFEPALLILVQTMSSLIQELGKWFDNNRVIVEAWALKFSEGILWVFNKAIDLYDFFMANKGLIEGVFIGIGVAIGVAVISFLIAHSAALIIIGAFAILWPLLQNLIISFGGIDGILKTLKPTLDVFYLMWSKFILPSLKDLWRIITTELIPSLMGVWNIISPLLIPVLQFLGLILMGVVFVAIMTIIEILKQAAKTLDFLVNVVGHAVGQIKQQFESLWKSVESVFNKIRGAMEKMNPFHRQSPSLVDNIKKGVGVIQDEYGKLASLALPSVNYGVSGFSTNAGMGQFSGSSSNNTSVTNAPVLNISLGNFIGTESELREFSKRINDSYENYLKGKGKA